MDLSTGTNILHDAVVETFTLDLPRRRLVVVVWEKKDGGASFWSQLVISGIKNVGEAQQVQACIDTIVTREKRVGLGYRIDELTLSKAADVQVALDIDHLPPLRLTCAKFTLQSLPEKPA
ncbi:hypothetical protein [Hymenobacter cellulosivorans]|uniref:Uncharacterized protein n=1 Tax=Hymenobacter cellulosivorans TaxID=2932249 RepID=A0ABY4F5E2_9BACT|nr:hypothetical protein [Hymenobacter cellulosivorans]UOQ51861.1 hypothetical protein MUN80_19115 [Hymenobacter cellulosivorans]